MKGGFERDYAREHGRAKRGVRAEDSRRGRKFQRLNAAAAVRGEMVLAPECYTHPAAAVFSEGWFEYELLPEVKRGQTVIMDSALFHREKALRKIMRQERKNPLFLPAYSPDFNKAEKKWANMKRASLEKAVYQYLGVSIS